VPADYLGGIDLTRAELEGGLPSYLNGRWKDRGWWYYYVEAFVIKEPVGFLTLIVWSVLNGCFRRSSSLHRSENLVLVFPALTYLIAVSSQTGFNHHLRYILPMFPYLIIGTGQLAHYFRPGHIKATAVVSVLAVWGAGSSLAVYPHSLSYFNEAVGGPEGGHAYLVDSNIDWGQDLNGLRDWLRSHPEARPLHLAYFNYFDPRHLGIEYSLPAPGPPEGLPGDLSEDVSQMGPRPGYYAISVNFLRGRDFHAWNGRGAWERIPKNAFSYFRRFKPIARAGYSIYIYHVTVAEAEAAWGEMGMPPLTPGEKLDTD
jgi:hypothetical protein